MGALTVHVEFCAELEIAGRTIGLNDLLFAAHAYALGATIATEISASSSVSTA